MIKRGTVFLYTGNVKRYKAVKEQIERHRRECGRKSLFLRRSKFINYAFVRANKRILGRNIDERSPRIDNRKDFGYWEYDLVLGHKTKNDVLLTLYERKTHRFFMIKIEDKTSVSIMKAFDKIHEFYGSKWNRIFKSITTDNGSEFADLSNLEQVSKTLVYYAHPYTFCNKGSVEGRIELIRRYIPKGDRMDKGSAEDVAKIEVWCNSLPRKILNYKTPKECFDVELDHIYRRR